MTGQPVDGAVAPWVWSVLRSSPEANAHVRYRAGALRPALMEHIVDDAVAEGVGADLEVTFWNAPTTIVAAVSRALGDLRRGGVAVRVFRGVEGDGRCNDGCGRDDVAADARASAHGHVHGRRWLHFTTGGESNDASSQRKHGHTGVASVFWQGGA